MASEIFPPRYEGVGKVGMFSSIQNLGHWNCQAKLEAGQVHQVGPMQQHRHREGKETNIIIRAVPADKGSCTTDKASSAGKLWEELDFKSLKMDKHCKDMWELLDGDKQQQRKKMFRNWQETWEKK
jgi:hypothetical protein